MWRQGRVTAPQRSLPRRAPRPYPCLNQSEPSSLLMPRCFSRCGSVRVTAHLQYRWLVAPQEHTCQVSEVTCLDTSPAPWHLSGGGHRAPSQERWVTWHSTDSAGGASATSLSSVLVLWALPMSSGFILPCPTPAFSRIRPKPVFISCDCCDKLPQTEGCRQQKIKASAGMAASGGCARRSFLCLRQHLAASGNPCGPVLPPSSCGLLPGCLLEGHQPLDLCPL